MYHVHEYLAMDALEKLCTARPEERGDAHRLLARYAGGEAAKRNYAGLHVALCLLWTEDAGNAEKLLTRRLGAKAGAASQLMAGCINDGILSEVKDATYLYRKGWLKDHERYYRVGRALGYGSDFHVACTRILPSLQPVLLAAIRLSHRRAGRDGAGGLSRRCLPYIAALLLSSEKETQFRLASLACRMRVKDHISLLEKSRRFVHHVAQRLNLALPREQRPLRVVPIKKAARRMPPANSNLKGHFYQRLRPFRKISSARSQDRRA